jgi:RNA polymerase sporulation-specific sigma factor
MEILALIKLKIKKLYIKFLTNAGNIDLDTIYYIGGAETLPPPLSQAEENEILDRLLNNDESVRKILVERNLRLVVYIAKKFENTGVGIEDLISIGTIGLMKAINTFNVRKNIKLATYASRCIENEILMHLRRSSRVRTEVSIDEPLNTDGDGNELLLSDILGTDEDGVFRFIEDEIDRELIKESINKLTKRERDIMELRFGFKSGNEKTQKEVADILGISQSYISRLEKRIICRMKRDMTTKI